MTIQYRLRTLLILLAIGPPLVAILYTSNDVRAILFYGCVTFWIGLALLICYVLFHTLTLWMNGERRAKRYSSLYFVSRSATCPPDFADTSAFYYSISNFGIVL